MTKNSVALSRTLFIADNLSLLESLDNESIDLICIDPPFAKNQKFVGAIRPPLSEMERETERQLLADWGIRNANDAAAAGIEWPDNGLNEAKFKDIWRWENDVHEDWIKKIEGENEALAWTIATTRLSHGEDTAAYLTYMAIRLIEMERVLKPTGSIYLHCDHSANAYLRMTMDAIFGRSNFRNEITWRRTHSKNAVEARYGTNHDTIFYYGKSATGGFYKDEAYRPYGDEIPNGYRLEEKTGRYYALSPVYADGASYGDSGQTATFRGMQYAVPNGRHWRVPGGRQPGENTSEGWARLDKAGRMYLAPNGKLPMYVRYLDEMPGIALDDVWTDIKIPSNTERTGYPTQKPVALAERIIKASTNPGDIVLDCFAGCAYVPVAAERNGRQWIACDISPRALTVLRRQFAKFRYAVNGERQGDEPALIADANVTVRSPHELPARTDESPEPIRTKPLPERKFKIPSSIIPEKEMLEFLLDLSGYVAWCCGFANRMSDGTVVETTKNFHLDHIDPKSKGGANQIPNRAPLCPYHNILKKDRWVHLREYRQEIADAGEMLVHTTDELIDLTWAFQKALDRYVIAAKKQGVQGELGRMGGQ